MNDISGITVKQACHDLRNVKATLESGFSCMDDPRKTETSRALFKQAFLRFDEILKSLENQVSSPNENHLGNWL